MKSDVENQFSEPSGAQRRLPDVVLESQGGGN
jgi:hypothetical protein